MRRTFLIPYMWMAAAVMVSAQTPAMPPDVMPSTLRLTVDDAVKMALDHNVDLNADRLDPQIGDTRVAAAAGAFRPLFSSSVQRTISCSRPPASWSRRPPTGRGGSRHQHAAVVADNAVSEVGGGTVYADAFIGR